MCVSFNDLSSQKLQTLNDETIQSIHTAVTLVSLTVVVICYGSWVASMDMMLTTSFMNIRQLLKVFSPYQI